MSLDRTTIAHRLRALLRSPSVPSREAMRDRGWHGYALDDSQLATDEALAMLDGFASLGVSSLRWCPANELFAADGRTDVRPLPFDLTLLDVPPFHHGDPSTWYSNRVVFDDELRAIVLVPSDGHRFFAGPPRFIRTVSAGTAGHGPLSVRFLGTDFRDPDLLREFAHELSSRPPDGPCEPGSEIETPPAARDAIDALFHDGRLKADAVRRAGWSLGVRTDTHDQGFASVAPARAFLALGASRLLMSRLSRPERAVPIPLSPTCTADGLEYGSWIGAGATDAADGSSILYPDDLSACVLVLRSGTFVFAGAREFVEGASRLRFAGTREAIVSDYSRRVNPSDFQSGGGVASKT